MYLLTIYEHNHDPRTYDLPISTTRAQARRKAREVTQDLNGFAVLYSDSTRSNLCEIYPQTAEVMTIEPSFTDAIDKMAA